MFNAIKELIRKKFIQDVSVLQGGLFVSMSISAITSIIFARLLGADNYGLYALIFSFVGLASILMDMGEGYAILTLLPAAYVKKDKQEIKNLLGYFIYVSLMISSVIGIIIILLAPFLSNLLYHRPEVGRFARYIFLALIIKILFSLLTLVLQSIRRIKSLTLVENFNKLAYLIIPVIFVLLGYGIWGIVFGHLVSAILFFMLSFLAYGYLVKKDKLLPSLMEILANFKNIRFWKYFKFSIFISVNKNLGNLYSLFPITFLGMFVVVNSQIAYFKIANGYLGLSLIFMTAISRILLVQLPKSLVYGKEIFKENLKKVSLIAGSIYIFILLIFLIFARFLVVIFYGQEYLPVVRLVYVLSLSYALLGFGVGYSSFFRTLDKLKALLLINLSVLISGILVFFIFFNFFSPLESAIILAIYFSTATVAGQGWYIIRYFKKETNEIQKNKI